MAELKPLPLGVQFFEGTGTASSDQLAQNLYIEKNPEGSKTPFDLLGTPGLLSFASVGDGPCRGVIASQNFLFVVSGNTLYRVAQDGTSLALGTVAGNGTVRMVENGTLVAILTNKEAYYASTTALTAYAPNEVDGVKITYSDAAYQDGYGIFTERGQEIFWITGTDANFNTISGLDFSSADTFADTLVGVVSDHRELWLFGKQSVEVWHNVGNALFPFQRAGAGFIEVGCKATGSIVKDNNSVFWLGANEDGDLRVYTAAGYQAQPISNTGIDRFLQSRKSPSTCEAFLYNQAGHTFYVLNFSDGTVVADLTTRSWHIRETFGQDRWRAQHHAFLWDKHIVGDFENGNLYELSTTTYTDNGTTIQRRTRGGPLHAFGQRAFLDELLLDIDAGVGLNSGQGSDPQVMLRFSDDGGRTFGNELWRSFGKIGEYNNQPRWFGLGSFKQRSIELTITDPVPVRIHGLYGRVDGAMQQ